MGKLTMSMDMFNSCVNFPVYDLDHQSFNDFSASAKSLLHLDENLLCLVGALHLQAPAMQQRPQVLGWTGFDGSHGVRIGWD